MNVRYQYVTANSDKNVFDHFNFGDFQATDTANIYDIKNKNKPLIFFKLASISCHKKILFVSL